MKAEIFTKEQDGVGQILSLSYFPELRRHASESAFWCLFLQGDVFGLFFCIYTILQH
jgi:hypothetical protein